MGLGVVSMTVGCEGVATALDMALPMAAWLGGGAPVGVRPRGGRVRTPPAECTGGRMILNIDIYYSTTTGGAGA